MKVDKLKDEASAILDKEVLEDLKEWYEAVLDEEWEYVVFVVRRSYNLALIMEKLTGKEMESSSNAAFLTDASFFLHCEELAEYYISKHRFPRILLCDDTLIHGRNINHYIECIENRLCSLLSDYSENEIKNDLVDAIRIHVYVRSDAPLLLLGRYKLNLEFKHRVSGEFIHQLSSSIAALILHVDMGNAGYIFTEHLSESQFETVDLSDYVETNYQNTKQFAKITYIGEEEEKKAVFTLRIVKNIGQDGYRVLPFVFLPNLGRAETLVLIDFIQERMKNRNFNKKFVSRLSDLEELPGKRTLNELITLLFSQAVLQEFNKKNKLEISDQDRKEEIRKLARNYNLCGLEDAEEMVGAFVSAELFSEEEIARFIKETVLPEREVLCVGKQRNVAISKEERRKIKEHIEDYVCKESFEEEVKAYELSQKPYFPTKIRSARSVRGCGFLLRNLNLRYTEAEADYSIAYFLQMMDAGVLSVSSFSSNSIKVVGFAQFAKTGEQSLLIEPLRLYEWIPVIEKIQRNCDWLGKDFDIELDEYGKSPMCDMDSELRENIKQFVDRMNRMGQKAEDWTGDYLSKKEIENADWNDATESEKRLRFLNLQWQHMICYDSYTTQ